jgi:D-alanyl-D-alanine carboxypeptidase
MRRLILALCALMGLATASPVQAASPGESPAVRQAKLYLQASQASDDARLVDLMREIYPTAERSPAEWLQRRDLASRMEFRAVIATAENQADLLLFDPLGQSWARLSITVEPNAPYRITALGLQPARRPADVAPTATLEPAALVAATRAYVDDLAKRDLFSGAVLVAKDGRPVWTGFYGLADRETDAPNTPQTQFRFGSMGKMFTAVAIMQLIQAGRIDPDVPIGRYLPDYPNAGIASKVTVNHLLTHTGGTGDIFGPEFDARRLTLRDPKDYVALFGARGPLFAPGTRSEYSNYGFILLGRIVETASGTSYDDYIQRHIFTPAGMTSTGMAPETAHLPRRAVPYTRDHGVLTPAVATLPVRGTPAGGGYSTVGDLWRFSQALMGEQLMDAEHTKRLVSGGVTMPGGAFFRYDFWAPGRHTFVGHGGGAPGMNGVFAIFPETGYVLVVLANRDPPVAQGVANFFAERIP